MGINAKLKVSQASHVLWLGMKTSQYVILVVIRYVELITESVGNYGCDLEVNVVISEGGVQITTLQYSIFEIVVNNYFGAMIEEPAGNEYLSRITGNF